MYTKSNKGYILLVTICLFIILFAGKSVRAEESRSDAIRIGCYLSKGLFEVDDKSNYSGYIYEYLQAISQYTGWDYEFVIAHTPDECIDMLQKGKVDLIGGMNKNGEYEKVFDYTNLASGYASIRLVTLKSNTNYSYEDFESFSGIRVSLISGSYEEAQFNIYCRKHNLEYIAYECKNYDDVLELLDRGSVNAALIGVPMLLDYYRVIAEFSPSPFYFVTVKGKIELLTDLNYALEQLKILYPEFDDSLHQKYFVSKGGKDLVLSREEKEYLATHSVITGLYDSNWEPIEYYDAASESFSGIMQGVFQYISNLTGLVFEFAQSDSFKDATAEFATGKYDILSTLAYDYDWADSKNANLTQPLITSSVVKVSKKDYSDKEVIALPEGCYTSELVASEKGASSTILYYTSIEECFNAINMGKADCTYVNSCIAEFFLRKTAYKNFHFTTISGMSESISIAVSKKADPLLFSILSKAVACIPNDTVSALIQEYTVASRSSWFVEYLYSNPVRSAVFLCIIFFVIVLLLTIIIRTKNKQNRLLVEKQKENEHYQEELRYRAEIDELTGIHNKNTFYRSTKEMLDANVGTDYTLFCCDIERFKIINDLFGIAVGDTILTNMSGILSDMFSAIGTIGRLEADHFGVCLPSASLNIKALLIVFGECFKTLNLDYNIIVKIGIYPIEDISLPVDQMCDRANLALQTIKGSFLQRYATYDTEQREQLLKEQTIVNKMTDALNEKQFDIYIQPQYNHVTGQIVSAEALARWHTPDGEVISPGDFIPVFERNGFITQLDEYIWERACQVLHDRINEGKRPVPIAVNISRVDIYNPNLCMILVGLIEKYNVPPYLLRLEITESSYVENPEQLITSVKQLQRHGFYVEMDDFGSGYSSLNTLKDVPFDMLKLDLKFLAGNDTAGRGGTILNSIVRMSKWLQLPLLAEGVETMLHADYLKSIGCDLVQGYLYARPMTVDDFNKLLDESNIGELIDTNRMVSFINIDDFWNPESQTSLVFNYFVGPAGVFELANNNIEALRINEKFFDELQTNRQAFERFQLSLLDLIYEEDRALLLSSFNEASVTGYEVFCETRWHRIDADTECIWLAARIIMIAHSASRKLFFIEAANTTKSKERELELTWLRNLTNKNKT